MGYTQEVKKYLDRTHGYFTNILGDFKKIESNLVETELYFHKSKSASVIGGDDQRQ